MVLKKEAGSNEGLHGENIIIMYLVLGCGHCVCWVIGDGILDWVSRALPLIDILALDQSGGAGLGHEPGLEDIIQPL